MHRQGEVLRGWFLPNNQQAYESGSAAWEILVSLRSQNRAGAVELVLHVTLRPRETGGRVFSIERTPAH